MMSFTHDEINLMTIYNTGCRAGLIEGLTDSVIAKLGKLSDAEFDALDLIPDFDEIIDDGEDL